MPIIKLRRICSILTAMITLAMFPIYCWAEDSTCDSLLYPWWVTDEAIEALQDKWFGDVLMWPDDVFDESFCINTSYEFSNVTFRYPSIRLYFHNHRNYKKGLDPHGFVGFMYGYTFSIYHEDVWVGHITLLYYQNEWIMETLLIHQAEREPVKDPRAVIYDKYKFYSNPDYVLSGGGDTFILIDSDRVSHILSIDNSTGEIVENALGEFLAEAHKNYLLTEERYPGYRDSVEVWKTRIPTIRDWATFKKEILGRN